MEEPTLHPAAPVIRLAELFPQLCFLSCSQYTLPQICLASFFLPHSLAGGQGPLPPPQFWPEKCGGTAQLRRVSLWCVSTCCMHLLSVWICHGYRCVLA